ncbi:uncharacterized protein LOC123723359 [Papilio machaon]|uniref:uncharacterized protein LOC123723359 n=1 Tax=Papilio machaon TaxID=76193 RepID=UPI001E6653E1|nr:uncharacterized protein LOC123723359 [Papilio machaon]
MRRLAGLRMHMAASHTIGADVGGCVSTAPHYRSPDTTQHNQLLLAMEECGISGPINRFFHNYLKERSMYTVVNGIRGAEAGVVLGVPTDSVFGPVGYIMHVNSVVNVVENCRVYMYADDMCLLVAGRDLKRMERLMQNDFDRVVQWAHDNGILLNIAKTKAMHIYSPYNRNAKKAAIQGV